MPNHALTDADRRKINAALHTLTELLPEVAKAKAAGEDVTEIEARMEHQRQRLMGLKLAYFNDKP